MGHPRSASDDAALDALFGECQELVDGLVHHIVGFLGANVAPVAERVAARDADPAMVLDVVALTLHSLADGIEADFEGVLQRGH